MKKIMSFAILALFLSINSIAVEYEVRSEFIYCTLNDGMTLEDAAEQAKEYGKFSKEQGTKYMQSMLVPIHAGETKYDYILWGSWPDGQAMYDEWGSYLNDYDESFAATDNDSSESAGECNARVAMFNNGMAHNRNVENRDKRQPVQFSGCTFKEGKNLSNLAEVIKADTELLTENGFSGFGRHTFLPYLGFNADYPYDFVDMLHWYSFERRGHMANNYGAFVEKYPDAEAGFNEVAECSPSKSFYSELLFNNVDG